MKRFLYLLCLCMALVGCNNTDEPTYNLLTPSDTFDKGSSFFYGNYYQDIQIQSNVVSLSLFSPNLSTDSLSYYVGTGTHLVLTDVFIAQHDTLLPNTTFVSSDEGSPLTFLGGKEFEGNVVGAYMVVVTETGYNIEILPAGQFTSETVGDSTTINFEFVRLDNSVFKPIFRGVLPMYDARQK